MAEPSIGKAFIEVHADTSPFHRELPNDLDKAADLAEGEFDKTGQKVGGKMGDGIGKELKRRGKKFAKSIEDGTKNTIVRVRSIIRFDRIRDSIRRSFRRDVGETISKSLRRSATHWISPPGGAGFSAGLARVSLMPSVPASMSQVGHP
jgi:hypothetical protein